MTSEQWAKMSDDEKRVTVHKLAHPGNWRYRCDFGWDSGYWHHESDPEGKSCDTSVEFGPEARVWPGYDYLHDLNACHEMEQASTIFRSWRDTEIWLNNLWVCTIGRPSGSLPDWSFVLRATAAQRCEAFVLTMEPEAQ